MLGFLFLMVIAGNETTTKLLANAAFWGHKNPDQLAPVYDDLSRIPLWVEETLRYDTSSQILARTVAGDLTLYDTPIPDGDVLLLLPGSAHRDERAFEDPDDYRHRPRHRFQAAEFRQRRALLPRRAPGPHGGPRRTRPSSSNASADSKWTRPTRSASTPATSADSPTCPSPSRPAEGPTDMPRFAPLPERRPAIVAGASAGIGEATAIELASRGFPVALGARRVEKLDDLVGKIRADGGEAVGFHLDVTDPNSVKSFVRQCRRRARRDRGTGGRRR